MRRMLGVLVMLSVAATAQADRHSAVTVNTPNGQVSIGMEIPDGDDRAPPGGQWVEETPDHRLVVRPDMNGRTLLKVVGSDDAVLHLWDDGREIYSDELPTVVETQPHRRYQAQVVFRDGSSWTGTLHTKRGMDTKLWIRGRRAEGPPVVVTTSAPPQQPMPPPMPPPQMGPQPITPDRFDRLAQAIRGESFPDQKLSVLRTAAAHEYFTCDQVGQLVDLYDFPANKVDAVRMTRPRIVDPENGYNLSSHFDFPSDKQTVQRMFQ